MPLTRDEIEVKRTPEQLQCFVEQVRERVRECADEFAAGMMKQGYYKEFLDEVVPLAAFAVRAYPPDYEAIPILGNQGYDAVVYDQSGKEVDKVEIANPIDGRVAAKTAASVVETGSGGLRVGDPGDDTEELIPIIERVAEKKSLKDYSDATVVFNVAALPPFEGFEARHEEQMVRIRDALAAKAFRAKRICILLPSQEVECIDA